MSISENYLNHFIMATEKVAYGASLFIGKEIKMLLTKEQ